MQEQLCIYSQKRHDQIFSAYKTIKLLLQLEVVDYEVHYPSDDIVEFLLNTKLSGKKSYNEFMNIICFINRIVPLKHQEIHDRIQKIAPKCTLYIVGRPIDAPMGTFSMFSPYPVHVEPIVFNIDITAAKIRIETTNLS